MTIRQIIMAAAGNALGGGGGGYDMDTRAGTISYLQSIKGTHAISCQFVELGDSQGMDPITDIHTNNGVWLGSIGGDYYWFGSPGPADTTDFNASAITYHAAGGIIMLSLGMPNPTTGGGLDDVSSLNASQVIVGGNATNTAFLASLDQIAAGLQVLETANVPVIIRPFHELNGNWFWWGTTFLSNAQFIAMWQYTYDYFTTTKGLSNLIWNYGTNAGYNHTSRYPGSAYVDVVGFDIYTSDPSDAQADYDTMNTTYPTKILMMNEFGSGDPSDGDTAFNEQTLINTLKTTMPNVVMWQQWWDGNGGGDGWGMASVTNVTAALADAWVLNRDELP